MLVEHKIVRLAIQLRAEFVVRKYCLVGVIVHVDVELINQKDHLALLERILVGVVAELEFDRDVLHVWR